MSYDKQQMDKAKEALLRFVHVNCNAQALDYAALAYFDIADAIRELARAMKKDAEDAANER